MAEQCTNSENKDVKSKEVCGATDAKENEDYLANCIGAFGFWQARVCILVCVARFMVMWNWMLIIFLTYDKEFICISFNTSIPDNVTESTCYDDCTKYEFTDGLFSGSFVAEFELICERAWMANMVQSMLMVGFLIGVFLFGWISDRYGRRTAFMISSFINVVLMVGSPFSPYYWVYASLRFFIGISSGGMLVVGTVIILEVVGQKHREVAASCAKLPDGIGEALLCVFAYFSPTWRVYILSIGMVSILILGSLSMLPETPRWLMAHGRLEQTKKLMIYAAKCNNLDAATVEENLKKSTAEIQLCVTKTNVHYWDLFRTTKMALRTLAMIFIWTVGGLNYFGINQYVSFLGSNVYISVCILGLIQVPACCIGMWLNKAAGRKTSTIGIMALIGLSMILLIFVPPGHWSAIVLGVIGMSASTTTFNVVYIYTSELYPTEIRNMGFGICTAGSKIGATVAPFVATLTPHWIPSLVFAVLPLMAACSCLILPETKGRKFQDHLD